MQTCKSRDLVTLRVISYLERRKGFIDECLALLILVKVICKECLGYSKVVQCDQRLRQWLRTMIMFLGDVGEDTGHGIFITLCETRCSS